MLVNDFGAINIDAKLVVGVEGETVNLANGCVCCSIRDDLITACLGLIQQPAPPDILIIETSGVSDPVQVANTFLMPELQNLLSLNSIIAVVDAEQFPGLQDEPAVLARLQIEAADMVVLNKIDLVGKEALNVVKAQIRLLAPGSRSLEASYCRVPLELLLGTEHCEAENPNRWILPVHSDHAHGHPFSTWHWTSDQPLSLPRLRSVFEALPDTVYRAKGIVYIEELPAYRVLLQMVGKRSNLKDAGQWGTEDPQSEIVMIGAPGSFDSDKLKHAFDACIGTGDESLSPLLRLNRFLTKESTETKDCSKAD